MFSLTFIHKLVLFIHTRGVTVRHCTEKWFEMQQMSYSPRAKSINSSAFSEDVASKQGILVDVVYENLCIALHLSPTDHFIQGSYENLEKGKVAVTYTATKDLN